MGSHIQISSDITAVSFETAHLISFSSMQIEERLIITWIKRRSRKISVILQYSGSGYLPFWVGWCRSMEHLDPIRMARTYFLGTRLLSAGYIQQLTLTSSWHHDIDPSNILVVSRKSDLPYDCDFKIADLGLAHFKRYESSLTNATDNNRYGTNTYGELISSHVPFEELH